MTILPFRKDLYDRGYIITSGFTDLNKIGEYCGTELKMEPTLTPTLHIPAGQNLDKLLKKASTIEDNLEEDVKEGYDIDFFANYAAIFRGERTDWCLNALEVTYCTLRLFYVNRENGNGELTISKPDSLDLTFTAPRNRLGFNPNYRIRIETSESDATPTFTRIIADFGYMMNDGKIYLKNPKQGNYYGNLYIEGTEYIGL